MSFIALSNTDQEAEATKIIMHLHDCLLEEELANCLMMLEQSTREWYLSILDAQHSKHEQLMHEEANTDETSECFRAECTEQPDTTDVRDTDSERHEQSDEKSASLEEARLAISTVLNELQPAEMAEMMMQLEPETRDWYLSLLTSQHVDGSVDSNVLDSGSSRHLQSEVCVTHNEDPTPLVGFN